MYWHGGQGVQANLRAFLNASDAQVVAVCDAYLNGAKKAGARVDQEYGTKGCRLCCQSCLVVDEDIKSEERWQ